MASFKKLGSGWQYRISYKDGDKYRTKSKNGFRTKKEAQLAAAKTEEELANPGFTYVSRDISFKDYLMKWYETFKKGKRSKTYYNDFKYAYNNVVDFFGNEKLVNITKQRYQEYLNWLGKDHTTGTVKRRHVYTKSCLEEAFHEGLLKRNPTHKVAVKGEVEGQKDSDKYLDYEAAQKLIKEVLSGIRPDWISRYMILVALATGVRFAELLAIEWDKIDFENNTVKITQAYNHMQTHEFTDPKTESSKRIVTIDNTTKRLLEEYKVYHRFSHPDYVFIDKSGSHVSNSCANKALKKACKRAGVKEITFHGLRHTYCSILLFKGINIQYISQRLGHSSIAVTYDIYSHIIKEFEEQESQKETQVLEELMNNAK